jgi:flavin reductase (DIM6/NTAB) family NADH-FMN oxidoreductase RutF
VVNASGVGRTMDQQAAFRGVAGQVVTGVSVVVTLVDGEPFATTVGAVVTASWDPPRLAVFVQTGARLAAALDQTGRFTVNVLGAEDHALARRFARPDRVRGWAAIAGVLVERRDPAPPRIASALAWADCTVVQTLPTGDHSCYLGDVRDAGRTEGAPLAYYRGRFRALGPAIAPPTWLALATADLATVW